MNSSALQQWKLGAIETAGNLGIHVLYVNQTWTVSSDTDLTITSQVTDQNGTLYFSSANCPSSGTSSSFVNGSYQLFIHLNNNGATDFFKGL